MNFQPKSICDHIECLSRLTGAPDAFITQVKALFAKKGISLNADASPYLKALEEAFRREESIRATTHGGKKTFDWSVNGPSSDYEPLARFTNGPIGVANQEDELQLTVRYSF